MDAVVYLRDCIFDDSCDCESNIETDLEDRTLCFTKNGIESYKFNLDEATPLISPTTNSPFTLYQLYVFSAYLEARDWADYVMEVGLAQKDPLNNGYGIEPIADSANAVCDELYNYLKGNAHIFHGLSVKTQAPKCLQIMSQAKKRKMEDMDAIDSAHEPPHKKIKYVANDTVLRDMNDSHRHDVLRDVNHNNDSLFTEHYDVAAIREVDNNEPFWMRLADPVAVSNYIENESDFRINWKEDYRQRIRESATRNTILNSLNGKSFGEVAKEFPKISKSLQKLMNGGAKEIKPKFILSQEEKTRRQRTEKPIIIVPHSNNSLLSFSNCVQFLKYAQYVEPTQSLHQMHKKKGGSGEPIILQTKSKLDASGSKKAEYEIRSSSYFSNKKMDSEEWNRVAAIFVIGKSWQFKKWISGWRKPEEIFNKTAGFYMHYKDDPPKGEVKDWRVHYLPILRNARHDDPRIYNAFWKTVHEHLRTKHKNKKLFF